MKTIDIDLDDPGRLIDLPIVDALYFDKPHNAWAVTFLPEDSVSSREKEIVTIAANSADGQRIALRLRRVSNAIGFPIERLIHSGGGNFTFAAVDGRTRELADGNGSADLAMRIYVELADISMTAQIAFLNQMTIAGRT